MSQQEIKQNSISIQETTSTAKNNLPNIIKELIDVFNFPNMEIIRVLYYMWASHDFGQDRIHNNEDLHYFLNNPHKFVEYGNIKVQAYLGPNFQDPQPNYGYNEIKKYEEEYLKKLANKFDALKKNIFLGTVKLLVLIDDFYNFFKKNCNNFETEHYQVFDGIFLESCKDILTFNIFHSSFQDTFQNTNTYFQKKVENAESDTNFIIKEFKDISEEIKNTVGHINNLILKISKKELLLDTGLTKIFKKLSGCLQNMNFCSKKIDNYGFAQTLADPDKPKFKNDLSITFDHVLQNKKKYAITNGISSPQNLFLPDDLLFEDIIEISQKFKCSNLEAIRMIYYIQKKIKNQEIQDKSELVTLCTLIAKEKNNLFEFKKICQQKKIIKFYNPENKYDLIDLENLEQYTAYQKSQEFYKFKDYFLKIVLEIYDFLKISEKYTSNPNLKMNFKDYGCKYDHIKTQLYQIISDSGYLEDFLIMKNNEKTLLQLQKTLFDLTSEINKTKNEIDTLITTNKEFLNNMLSIFDNKSLRSESQFKRLKEENNKLNQIYNSN